MLEKKYLIVEEFFKLFKQEVDETEANTLRLALANLPPAIRQKIAMQTHKSLQRESTELEQLNFIINRLIEQETEIVDKIVAGDPLKSLPKDNSITRIAKLIVSDDSLRQEN